MSGEYGYVCYFNNVRWECYAPSLWEAKQKAIKHFKPKKNKQHMVSVHLCERPDGETVTHTAVD